MKKWKSIVSIVMLAVVAVVLFVGVYAAVKGTGGVNNKTDFIIANENVFVKISGTYTGPQSTSAGSQKTFTYTIDQSTQGAYDETQKAIPSWNIGATNFTRTEKVMTIDFVFENLNEERSLQIDINNIAVDPEQHFITTYCVANEEDEFENATFETFQSAVNNAGAIRDVVISSSATVYIRIVYTLDDFEKTFSFNNALSITLATV